MATMTSLLVHRKQYKGDSKGRHSMIKQAMLLLVIFSVVMNSGTQVSEISVIGNQVFSGSVPRLTDRNLQYRFTSAMCRSLVDNSVPPSDLATGKRIPVKRSNDGHEFEIKVYEKNDIVSECITNYGTFEADKIDDITDYIKRYSEEKKVELSDMTFVDIGANIGWFTMNIAAMGVNVIAFEPMEKNLQILKESICLTSNIESGVSSRITVNGHGLGVKEDMCFIYSGDINVGDGHVKCGVTEDEFKKSLQKDYSIRQKIPVLPLDDVIKAGNAHIPALKMDTEGFEPHVVEGGQEFFLRGGTGMIITEFVPDFVLGKGGDPKAFLETFVDAGYMIQRRDKQGFMTRQEIANMTNFGSGFDPAFIKMR